MKYLRVMRFLLLGAVLMMTLGGVKAQSGSFTLGIYQGVRFSDNKIVDIKDSSADLTVYPSYKGIVAYATLQAKNLKEFENKPNLTTFSPTDFHDQLVFAPSSGYYYLTQSNDNRYYLCKLAKFENQGKAVSYWKLTFSYEQVRLNNQPVPPTQEKTTPEPTMPDNSATHAKKTYPDGSSYEGEFRNGKFHGAGILKSAEGDYYEGQFVNGQFQGRGVLKLANGTYYEGEFYGGEFQGKGSLQLPDGSSYQGDFINSKYQGRGLLRFPDGTYYEGYFSKGKCQGEGTLFGSDGTIRKKGQWANNQYLGSSDTISDVTSVTAQESLYRFDDFNTLYFDFHSMKNVTAVTNQVDLRFGSAGSFWYLKPYNGASIVDLGLINYNTITAPSSGYSAERVSVELNHVYAVRCSGGVYGILKITAYDLNKGTAVFTAKQTQPEKRLNLYYLSGDYIRFDLETMNCTSSSQNSDLYFSYSRTTIQGENGALIKDLGVIDYDSAIAPQNGYTDEPLKVVRNHVYAVKSGRQGFYVIKTTNVMNESDIEFQARPATPGPTKSAPNNNDKMNSSPPSIQGDNPGQPSLQTGVSQKNIVLNSLFFFSSAYGKSGNFVRLNMKTMAIEPLGIKGDYPAVSLDGKYLVYQGSGSAFHAFNIETGVDREFERERADYSEPVFLSNHLFGFLKYRNDTLNMSLCIKSILDGNERQLPHQIPDKIHISADIAYIPPLNNDLPFVIASGDSLYLVTAKKTTVLYTSDNKADILRYPAVSPDGKKVLFVSDLHKGLWVINIDGTSLKQLIPMDCQYSAWSPDGQNIVFSSVSSASRGLLYQDSTSGDTWRSSGSFTHRIWVMKANGATPRLLPGPDGKGVGIMGILIWR